MTPGPFHRNLGSRRAAPAFTLLELLVVMGIIAVIAASLLIAGTTMINKAKARKTRAVLGIVRDAVDQFAQDQSAASTLGRSRAYQTRYGFYPPDELEVFTPTGIPNSNVSGPLTVGGASVIPAPTSQGLLYSEPMRFHLDGAGAQRPDPAFEHRDLAAMILAIKMFNETADEMLNHIPSSHRVPGPVNAQNQPVQFLNRNDDEVFTPGTDEQIDYIIDDWGTPIAYFAQRDYTRDAGAAATVSGNHPAWNQGSTAMIRANRGQPIICSYGADGPEQLTWEILNVDEAASLIGDWEENADGAIDHRLNEDNVYPDDTLKEKLRKGAPSE